MDEQFGNGNQLVAAWKAVSNVENRAVRLKMLLEKAQIAEERADAVAYQLIQRTASAVIEAETFNARYAIMLVHSFSPTSANFSAFEALGLAYGVMIKPEQLVEIARYRDIRLFIGWVQGDLRYLRM